MAPSVRLSLTFQSDRTEVPRLSVAKKTDKLSSEKRGEIDQKAALEEEGREIKCAEFQRTGNTAKRRGSLQFTINEVIGDLYTWKPSRSLLSRKLLQGPFELPKKCHARHPLLPQFRAAHIAGMGDKQICLFNRKRRDGRHEYLSNAGTSDATKIYKMIRRRDGRSNSVTVYPCAAPLLQDGTY